MIIRAGLLDRILRFCTTINRGVNVRPQLNAIIVTEENGAPAFVTSDGHRIGRVVLSEGAGPTGPEYLIPLDTVKALRGIIASYSKIDMLIEIQALDNVLYVADLEAVGLMRLPPIEWRHVVCNRAMGSDREVILNAGYLADAAKAMKILGGPKCPTTRVSSIRDGDAALLQSTDIPGVGTADILISGYRR